MFTMKKLLLPLLAVAGLAVSFSSHAASSAPSCSIEVEGRPGKKFSPDHIDVDPACQTFTVHLKHVGKKNKEEAGHNWVLVKAADIEPVIQDGLKTGVATDFLPKNDSRVLAKTVMLGGGERASVSFPVDRLRAGETYTYFCSFPKHAMHMRGTLRLRAKP